MDQPPPPLPQSLEADLRRELTSGERVLWRGQPLAKRLKGGFGIWLFAVPWTLFALFWESMALLPWSASSKTPDGITWTFGIIMPIFGLPFVAIGLWMLWKPIKAMRQAGQTLYALTDRRVVRLVGGRTRELHSVLLDQIGPMNRRELPDGTGHLRIETHSTTDSDGDRQTQTFDVFGVPGVAQLERLILENRKA